MLKWATSHLQNECLSSMISQYYTELSWQMKEYHLNLQTTAEGVGFSSFKALSLMFQSSKNCAHELFHHIFDNDNAHWNSLYAHWIIYIENVFWDNIQWIIVVEFGLYCIIHKKNLLFP